MLPEGKPVCRVRITDPMSGEYAGECDGPDTGESQIPLPAAEAPAERSGVKAREERAQREPVYRPDAKVEKRDEQKLVVKSRLAGEIE